MNAATLEALIAARRNAPANMQIERASGTVDVIHTSYWAKRYRPTRFNIKKFNERSNARMAATIAKFEDQEMFAYTDPMMGWM